MTRTYDHIIVGSGLAGLYTAYQASKHGKVALLTKSDIRESNSYFAQGGIAAVTGEDDAPRFHFQDTISMLFSKILFSSQNFSTSFSRSTNFKSVGTF